MKPLTWDTNIHEHEMIKPQAEAVKYLKEEGALQDCADIKDREQQANCIAREKKSKELPTFRFRQQQHDNLNPIFN